jgi:hypothetical protein
VSRAHRRKSKNFTAPTGGPPTVAFVDTHPLRTVRAGEVFLLSCLFSDVRADWLIRAGAIDTEQVEAGYQLVAKLLGPTMRQVEAGVADKSEDDLQYQGLVPTILWAATRWICALELPQTGREVWEGPPLGARLKSGPPSHPPLVGAG